MVEDGGVPRKLRAREVGLAVTLAVVFAALIAVVQKHYPLRQWLFFKYASYGLLCAVFTAACLSAGYGLVRAVHRERLPIREQLALSLALGLLAFFGLMFVGGLLGLYGTLYFVALPLAMMASGAVAFSRDAKRMARMWRLRKRLPGPRASTIALLATLFGACGLALVYASILTPRNIGFDARWYHLPLAEHYAALGAVRAFPEGWFQGALPHLASFIYTWAFLLPRSTLFDRVELAAHLEFTLFVWTLFCVPVLVRWAAPRLHVRGSWAAIFLFSGIFLYDSGLCGGADHIAAFWGVPILLSLRRASRTFSAPSMGLLAAFLSGAALTKYQAMSLLFFPIAFIGVRALTAVFRRRSDDPSPRAVGRGVLVAAITCIVCTAPHWLKNWVFYGDPIYPFLARHLHAHPWNPDFAHSFKHYIVEGQLWAPRGTLPHRLGETLREGLLFAVHPHDWISFHGDKPVFGFLFSAALVCLPFIPRASRLWMVFGAAQSGVFVWYWSSHQDRYLQALVPWMAAATVAAFVRMWQLGWPVRAGVTLLVGFQIVWGGDVFSFPTHSMMSSVPVKASIDLLSTGHRKDFASRYAPVDDWENVGARLHRGDRVLVHDSLIHLGLGVPSVTDSTGLQGGLAYARISTPRELHDRLVGYAVTHVVALNKVGTSLESLAVDIVFWEYFHRYVSPPESVGSLLVSKLAASPPPERRWLDEKVALFPCPGTYAPGIYRVGDVTVSPLGKIPPFPAPLRPATREDIPRLPSEVSFIAFDASCQGSLPDEVSRSYSLIVSRGSLGVWSKQR